MSGITEIFNNSDFYKYMSHFQTVLLVITGLLLVLTVRVAEKRLKSPKKNSSTKRTFFLKEFMNESEKQLFYSILGAIVPNLYVYPQVAMSALIDAHGWGTRSKFNSKRVDFVICKKNFKVVCVIELDGHSHQGKELNDLKRDIMLKEAGITTIRYKTNNMPSSEQIRNDIAPLL